jgi:hypothetical protein
MKFINHQSPLNRCNIIEDEIETQSSDAYDDDGNLSLNDIKKSRTEQLLGYKSTVFSLSACPEHFSSPSFGSLLSFGGLLKWSLSFGLFSILSTFFLGQYSDVSIIPGLKFSLLRKWQPLTLISQYNGYGIGDQSPSILMQRVRKATTTCVRAAYLESRNALAKHMTHSLQTADRHYALQLWIGYKNTSVLIYRKIWYPFTHSYKILYHSEHVWW